VSQAEYGVPPSGYAGYAYSAVHVTALAAQKAGTITNYDAWAKALEGMEYDTYKGKQWYRACDHQAIQRMFIARGRSKQEAEALGRGKYGFREIVAVIEPYDGMERSCADRGYK